MTTAAMRVLGIIVLAYFIAACTRVGHIQRNDPIRMMTFPASHQAVAQCTQQRLSAKLKTESFDTYVVYNSAKGRYADGFTHYAITIGKAGEKGGFAEMRVQRPAPSSGPGQTGGQVPLSESALDEFWKTVQDCAAGAKPSA
jgi:hypothetical protein